MLLSWSGLLDRDSFNEVGHVRTRPCNNLKPHPRQIQSRGPADYFRHSQTRPMMETDYLRDVVPYTNF
jgi:hypothetical protein